MITCFWRLVSNRWCTFALLGIVVLVWVVNGWHWSQGLLMGTDRASWYKAQLAEWERRDSALAAVLQRLRDRYGEEVATIALYGSYKEQGLQGMRYLAARAQAGQTPYEVRLAAVAHKMLPKHLQNADAKSAGKALPPHM